MKEAEAEEEDIETVKLAGAVPVIKTKIHLLQGLSTSFMQTLQKTFGQDYGSLLL